MIRRIVFLTACAAPLVAQAQQPPKINDTPVAAVLKLDPLVGRPSSELVDVVERYAADQQSLNRRYDATDSPAQRKRMREFYTGWRARLTELSFDRLSQEGKADYVLLDNHAKHQLALLDRQDKMRSETA